MPLLGLLQIYVYCMHLANVGLERAILLVMGKYFLQTDSVAMVYDVARFSSVLSES